MTALAPLLALLLAAAPARAGDASRAPEGARARARRLFVRAELAARAGAASEALRRCEEALEADPGSAFLAGEAAELALEAGEEGKALAWAEKSLELSPRRARSRLTRGRVLAAAGREEEARGDFEAALALDPAEEEAVYALVELFAASEPARARALLERRLRERPESASRVLVELARLDAQEGRYARAVERLKRAVEQGEAESAPARLLLGQVYEASGDTAAAAAEYARLLADEPEDRELWARLGALQAGSGDLEAARETFRTLKRRHPGDPAACAWLAADAERAGDFRRAAAELRESSQLSSDPGLWLRLGRALLQAGELPEAVRALEEARRRWPGDDRVAYFLGLGLDDLGRRREAAALLREVLAARPGDRAARWHLAAALERSGRPSEAERELRLLLAEEPEDAKVLNFLAYSLAERGAKLEEAEALARKAVALAPGDASYRDTLGWALHRRSRRAEALAELKAAAEARPEDAVVLDHLGEAYKASGEEAAAWRVWRKAQVLGAEAAGRKAERLQKPWDAESSGELWLSHLSEAHGGLAYYSGLCRAGGRVGGRELSFDALFSFRAPGKLLLELLGPLLEPIWRARLDADGFTMDRLPVEELDGEQAEEAVHGALTLLAAVLSGEPFRPGPGRYAKPWRGPRAVEREGWIVELGEDGRAASAARPGGDRVRLSVWKRLEGKEVPAALSAGGRFWDISLACSQPKAEFEKPGGAR